MPLVAFFYCSAHQHCVLFSVMLHNVWHLGGHGPLGPLNSPLGKVTAEIGGGVWNASPANPSTISLLVWQTVPPTEISESWLTWSTNHWNVHQTTCSLFTTSLYQPYLRFPTSTSSGLRRSCQSVNELRYTKYLVQMSYPTGYCVTVHRGCANPCVRSLMPVFIKPKCGKRPMFCIVTSSICSRLPKPNLPTSIEALIDNLRPVKRSQTGPYFAVVCRRVRTWAH